MFKPAGRVRRHRLAESTDRWNAGESQELAICNLYVDWLPASEGITGSETVRCRRQERLMI